MKAHFFVMLIALSLPIFAGEDDPETVYKQALEQLTLAQSDQKALVPAVKLLVKAVALFEGAKAPEDKIAEVNSCLYWAKKRMTIQDADAIKNEEMVIRRVDVAVKPVEQNDSEKWFKRADDYAVKNPKEQLIIAIRYFEVADRFKSTDSGRKAMDLSLKALQQVQIGKEKPLAPKVPGEKLKVTKLPKLDPLKLTSEVWALAPGKEIKVDGYRFTETKIEIGAGEEYIVLPNPTDKWSWDRGNWTFSGDPKFKGRLAGDANIMALIYKISKEGEWKAVSSDAITGDGLLIFGPNDDQVNDNRGSVRIKIVRVK